VTEPKVWTVSQVNRAVRSVLESSIDALWIGGEIGNWTRSRAGHCYFTLKDEKAQLRSVMFSREAGQLPTDPEVGMRVRAFGSLTLYEARGEYQFVVRKLEAEGAEGLWRIAFEKLRGRLETEGLLDAALKRPLPKYPSCIGVVTSPTGAALRDITSVLRRRAPWVRVLLSGSRVQGAGASEEIARALEALAETGIPDVIIVGRGGGSLEDLWAFNEEPVARAVAACPIPVVSAVGHEVDVTISDLVADARAATPSAAAEAVVPDRESLLVGLRGLPERLGRGLQGAVERRRLSLRDGLSRMAQAMERGLAPPKQTLDLTLGALEGAFAAVTGAGRQRLATAAGRLEALSPLATLDRGYSVARDGEGRVLRRMEDFPPGKRFSLRVRDGEVACEALDIHEENEA
jgi:exodeoxyribonuclease VII large subunit